MKAYFATTGTLFGLLALRHILLAIDERHLLETDPGNFWGMVALGVVAAALSVWGWRLFWRRTRS